MCGITQWIERGAFAEMLRELSGLLTVGSAVVFDYPDAYHYDDIEKILSRNGFLIYEHMDAEQIGERFFKYYNLFERRHMMRPPKDISYCLAVSLCQIFIV